VSALLPRGTVYSAKDGGGRGRHWEGEGKGRGNYAGADELARAM